MRERLQKVISHAGIASRREAEQLILEGRVAVNGAVVTQLGTKVDPARDKVKVDGSLLKSFPGKVYIVLNKPAAYVSTLKDPQGRPVVVDLLDTVATRVFSVGRLDYDAEGLLLLTNDGELAHKLQHPTYRIVRTYEVKVRDIPTSQELSSLRNGVQFYDFSDALALPTDGPTKTPAYATQAAGKALANENGTTFAVAPTTPPDPPGNPFVMLPNGTCDQDGAVIIYLHSQGDRSKIRGTPYAVVIGNASTGQVKLSRWRPEVTDDAGTVWDDRWSRK